MKLCTGLLAGALLIVTAPVCAQTLGDIARKEQERRKATPPAARTYTNDDLKKLVPFPGEAKPGDAEAKIDPKTGKPVEPTKVEDPAKPGDAAKDGAKTPEPAKDEKHWRGRITAVRDEIARNESFRDALQTQINSLSADFAGRDDPAQRAQIADNRQKKMAELGRVNSEIEKANKLIVEIEDEARRAGVPPGWLR
jgi:hypothetical protein